METITLVLLFCFCAVTISKAIYSQRSRPWFRNRKSSSFFFATLEKASSPADEKEVPLKDSPPYVFPRLQPKTCAPTSMGLKRLDAANWLTMDDHYHSEHTIRKSLLATNHSQVVQCLKGSEEACHEVLQMVVTFLSSRYPQHFTLGDTPYGQVIHNHITNESFSVGSTCPNPLEIAARLAMEDFNILIKNSETGEYHLMASATLFPAGWKLQERIGTSMANLHAPVPEWKKNLGGSVNRYFDYLNSRSSMERYNLFIQSSPHLFMDAPEVPAPSTTPEDLGVRRERQVFRRLEQTNAVLFTVRTYMQPLVSLETDEGLALKQQIGSWGTVSKAYKGGEVWGPAFAEWERRFDIKHGLDGLCGNEKGGKSTNDQHLGDVKS